MIEVSENVAASAQDVWAILATTRMWPLWGPSVKGVEHHAPMINATSTGRVRVPLGLWVPFVITEFEPGAYFRWQVAGIPATGHRVVPLGEERSRVVFEIPVWAAPYAVVCKYACRKIAKLAEA